MVRFLLILGVAAAVFVLYSIIDAAMTDPRRVRGVSKPVWILIVVLLPVIGGVLWFMLGKGKRNQSRPLAPDDDPAFFGGIATSDEFDQRIRDLEKELADLDAEADFPASDKAPDSSPDKTPGKTPGKDSETNADKATDSAPPKTDGPDTEADHPKGSRSADD